MLKGIQLEKMCCPVIVIGLGLCLSGQGVAQPGFDQTLELQGIRFHVSSANNSSINQLRVEPAGLEIDNSSFEAEVDGAVVGAEMGDIDANGSPELYVFVSSAGSGSYGSLAAWAVNNRKSLSQIYLPPLDQAPDAIEGYMGHDRFRVTSNAVERTFPIYCAGDVNSKPTGGTWLVRYELVPGEAGWALRVSESGFASGSVQQHQGQGCQ